MSLTFTPHKYQEKAILKLLGQASVGLFQDPGLGKTAEVLSAYKILKSQGLADRMLVIAPLRPVYSVWPPEIQKWLEFNELTFTILHGDKKELKLKDDVDIFLINPEGVTWLLDPEAFPHRLATWMDKRCVLCIDESTRFKSSASKRFKAIKRWLYVFERRWILTGTPMPNTIEDLFSQIYILDEGAALGRYVTHFRNRYMYQPNPRLPYVRKMLDGSFDEISDLIAPLVMSMKAEDYIDMPNLVFNDILIDLDKKTMDIYREVEDEFIALIQDDLIVASNAAVAGTKCRQIANGAVYLPDSTDWIPVHDHKLDAIEGLLEELGAKPKLILYEYKHDLERIQERFGPFPNLSGASPAAADAMINKFNKGEIATLLGHPASMGHGLNIQAACNHVIMYGITWNFEHYDQAMRRVYRQGQLADSVFVHRLIARNTKDVQVAEVLLGKEARQEDILTAVVEVQKTLY